LHIIAESELKVNRLYHLFDILCGRKATIN